MYRLKQIAGLVLASIAITGTGSAQSHCTAVPPAVPAAPAFSGEKPFDGYQVLYHQMWEFIRDNYYDPSRLKNWQALEHAYDDKLATMDDIQLALKLLAEATGDQWTVYSSPRDVREFAAVQKQGLVLGGLMLYRHGARYKVDVIHYGSAAYGTALRERDTIACLNRVPIDSLSQKQVDILLRGTPGEKITVTAISAVDGSEYEAELTLVPDAAQKIEGELLPGNIIHIRMPTFSSEGYITKFVEKFVELSYQAGGDVKGMVLDLRNNLGGELPAATKFSSLFLDESQVVTQSVIRGRPVKRIMAAKADEIVAAGKPIDGNVVRTLRKLPLAVLVNGSSASAAEVTLGALKDNGRGTVIGVTSFGKGVGYKTQPGPVGGLMSLTAFKYLTPAGHEVHELGIDPDVSVVVPRSQTKDIQLSEAISRLNARLGSRH